MNYEAKIIFSKTLFIQNIDDEMVLLDTQRDVYFALDAIGRVMWEQLNHSQSLQDLITYMLENYDVEENVLKKDIEIFIEKLLNNKLITLEQM
jgi:hypothetical protein